MKKEIGTRIRKLRESKDYTQDNMAAELDITAGAYAKIERGETDPSATRLVQIAEILEVDVTSFFRDVLPQANNVEEPNTSYGFATKHEVENLSILLKHLKREVEKLKLQIPANKKTVSKKSNK